MEEKIKLKKEDLDMVIAKLEKGIPSERIQLGGQVDSIFKGQAHVYMEGTDILPGSVNIRAAFDETGKVIGYGNEGKTDWSKGVLIKKEIAFGGREMYEHQIFYLGPDRALSLVAEFKDSFWDIIPVAGRPFGESMKWYSFYSTMNRRFKNTVFKDSWIVLPFEKTYLDRYAFSNSNPNVPMEDGLIYFYPYKEQKTLILERTDEVDKSSLIYRNNFKKDTLRIGNKVLLEAARGQIDIVKCKENTLYIAKSDVIDVYGPEQAFKMFEHARPSNKDDYYIKREFDSATKNGGRFAPLYGMQMDHKLYKLDLPNLELEEIADFYDEDGIPYEYCFEPDDLGIKVISRLTGKEWIAK